MTRKSTFHRDLQNCGHLSIGKPVHQMRGANRNRETDRTLPIITDFIAKAIANTIIQHAQKRFQNAIDQLRRSRRYGNCL
jgi:hypothetical protein